MAARRQRDPEKVAIAMRPRPETMLTIEHIASRLIMGSPKSASARANGPQFLSPGQRESASAGLGITRPQQPYQALKGRHPFRSLGTIVPDEPILSGDCPISPQERLAILKEYESIPS